MRYVLHAQPSSNTLLLTYKRHADGRVTLAAQLLWLSPWMTVEIVKTICEILEMLCYLHTTKRAFVFLLLFALANVSGLGKWLSTNVYMNNY